MKESGVGVLKIKESESEVFKIEESESESESGLLCTDSIALTISSNHTLKKTKNATLTQFSCVYFNFGGKKHYPLLSYLK
jgi:hypothetical protein